MATANPSFTLNVTFYGMCLLVRDEANPSIVRVLMPETPSDGCDSHDTLLYAYGANTRRYCRELTSGLESWRIDGADLTFTGPGETPLLVPSEVLRIHGDADTDSLNNTDLPDLDARVTLRSGHFSDVIADYCWEVDRNEKRAFAYAVTWTARVPGDSLTLSIPASAESSSTQDLVLFAKDCTLDLWILHITPAESLSEDEQATMRLPEPEIDEMPMHIHFYSRALQPGAYIPDLRFQSKTPCSGKTRRRVSDLPALKAGPSSFSCMLAAIQPTQ